MVKIVTDALDKERWKGRVLFSRALAERVRGVWLIGKQRDKGRKIKNSVPLLCLPASRASETNCGCKVKVFNQLNVKYTQKKNEKINYFALFFGMSIKTGFTCLDGETCKTACATRGQYRWIDSSCLAIRVLLYQYLVA